jgi:hypothetical protein
LQFFYLLLLAQDDPQRCCTKGVRSASGISGNFSFAFVMALFFVR